MKTKTFATIILPAVLFIAGCKKDLDYRDKYIGKYLFEVSGYSWVMGQGATNSDIQTTEGEVYYEKGEAEQGMIRIRYLGTGLFVLKIDTEGKLSWSCGSEAGAFDNLGNVEFTWASNNCPGGGFGGGWSTTLKGHRL